VELLRLEFLLLARPLRARLFVRLLQEHLLHEFRVIEALRITFEECHRRERALLCMQFACFLKLKQRRDEERARRIDDHHPLTFLQSPRKLNALDGSADDHGDCDEEPESREAILVDENADGIGALIAEARRARSRCGAAEFGCGCFHG